MLPLDQAITLQEAARRRGPRPAAMVAMIQHVLREPLVRAFLRFLAVGGVGLAVDAALFALLDAGHMAPERSRAASLAVATVVTWWLNRRHTFGASHRRPWIEAMRYGAVTLVAQGFSYAVFLGLVYEVPALPRLLSLLVGAGLAAIVGFTGHKLFAFSRPTGTPGSAPGH
jgi:putative flippase GtrA